MSPTKQDFRYTSPREKLSIIQALLKQFYESPTRGNSGKGNLFSAAMSQKDLADALGVSIPTISRLLTEPKFQHLIEAHGIVEYRDPLYGGPKRYIYNPETVTITVDAPQEIQSVVEAAKAMLYPTTTAVTNGAAASEDTNSKSKSSSKPAGIELTAGQKLWLEKYDKIHAYYREMLPDVATEAFEWLLAKWLEEKIVNVTLDDKTTPENGAELLEQYKTETGKEYAK